jgi:hypothetical protein
MRVNMEIILIGGKKRSGKDYFASLLQEELYKNEKTSCIISFADPLKEIISKTFDISLETLDEYKNRSMKVFVPSDEFGKGIEEISNFRSIIQRLGTEAMKPIFGDDVWTNILLKKAQESNVDFVIVPDFRFKVEKISELTIEVINEDIESMDSHSSENELKDFKFKFSVNILDIQIYQILLKILFRN